MTTVFLWYVLIKSTVFYTQNLKDLHETLVGLIEFYIYVDGITGIVHYFVQRYFRKLLVMLIIKITNMRVY